VITPRPEIIPANTRGLHRVTFAVGDIEAFLDLVGARGC
jgi:hypothetical protein